MAAGARRHEQDRHSRARRTTCAETGNTIRRADEALAWAEEQNGGRGEEPETEEKAAAAVR